MFSRTSYLVPEGRRGPTAVADHSPISGLLPAFPTTLDREKLLEAAYKTSLTDGVFFDAKFYVYSRRRNSGVVDTPRAVYGNSAILRASSQYFTGLLAGGFAEGTLCDLNAPFPRDKEDSNAHYDYEGDSDLEDATDADVEEWSGEKNKYQLGMAQDAVVGLGPAMSDVSSPVEITPEQDTSESDRTATEPSTSSQCEGLQKGRVIVMPDVAFVTWRALMFYLGTGKISFAPLHSQGLTTTAALAVDSDVFVPPPCSPKSMYRLACQLELESLAKLAIDGIQDRLSAQNILHELFSPFSARYPEVIEMQASFCCGLSDSSILQDLTQWSENIAKGRLPHSAPALAVLIQKLMGPKDLPGVVPSVPGTPQAPTAEPEPDRLQYSYPWGPEDSEGLPRSRVFSNSRPSRGRGRGR